MKNKSKTKRFENNSVSMVSAMIPGAEVDKKGHVMVNVAISNETIIFNIGGTIFETYRATLCRLPNSPLANEKFLKNHYRSKENEYFFDRDPDIFRATLNYLRTGELHIPSYICGPAAKMELEFWGVMPNWIERCCWTNYNEWNSTFESLKQLDHDRIGSTMSTRKHNDNCWDTVQAKIWTFLDNPDSCIPARIYGVLSYCLVLLSIFSFVASTTKAFKMTELINNQENGSAFNNSLANTSVGTAFGEIDANANNFHPVLRIIDYTCLTFFTAEFIIRFICTPVKYKFAKSLTCCIDLFAIMPDYMELIVFAIWPKIRGDTSDLNIVTAFRILRVFRIFRLIKHVPGLWILIYTLKASIGELVLLVCFMSIGMVIFSSLIFFAEERDKFESIPHGFWWAIITMTTVGYGDMCPTTATGKLVGSLCAMSGLLMIGFSVPPLVNNFTLYYKHVLYTMQAERTKAKYAKMCNAKRDLKMKKSDLVLIDISGEKIEHTI